MTITETLTTEPLHWPESPAKLLHTWKSGPGMLTCANVAGIQLATHRKLFILSKHFIQVRFMVDPDPLLGTLRVKWEYILNGTPVHHITSHPHIHTSGQFSIYLLVCIEEVGGNWRTQKKPTRIQKDHAERTLDRQYPKLRIEPWSCEVAELTTASKPYKAVNVWAREEQSRRCGRYNARWHIGIMLTWHICIMVKHGSARTLMDKKDGMKS